MEAGDLTYYRALNLTQGQTCPVCGRVMIRTGTCHHHASPTSAIQCAITRGVLHRV